MSELISSVAPTLGVLIIFGLTALVGIVLLGFSRKSTIAYPYVKQPSLFTPAERSFLGVLEQAVGD